ncbi:MAG TPA: hypothetical protein VFZ70_01125 [Euzebyales bacterium]
MTAAKADVFVPIRPGTDVALVRAMVHVLDREELTDADRPAAHTTGWDELRRSAAAMPPPRAATITGSTTS